MIIDGSVTQLGSRSVQRPSYQRPGECIAVTHKPTSISFDS